MAEENNADTKDISPEESMSTNDADSGGDDNEGKDEKMEEPVDSEFALKMRELRRLYDLLLEDYPVNLGKAISKKQRERLKDPVLAYGEVKLNVIALSIRTIKEEYEGLEEGNQIFYDLGSGVGKAVFAATLLNTWKRCVGVEVLSGLFNASLEIADRWKKMQESIDDDVYSAEQKRTEIDFLHQDVASKEFTMSDGTLGFANSTCFDENLMIQIAAKADKMKGGSFFITVTKRLPSLSWEVLEKEKHKMSWGEALVFIHRKKPDDWQETRLKMEEKKKAEEEEEEERLRQEAEDAENEDEDLLKPSDGIEFPPE